MNTIEKAIKYIEGKGWSVPNHILLEAINIVTKELKKQLKDLKKYAKEGDKKIVILQEKLLKADKEYNELKREKRK